MSESFIEMLGKSKHEAEDNLIKLSVEFTKLRIKEAYYKGASQTWWVTKGNLDYEKDYLVGIYHPSYAPSLCNYDGYDSNELGLIKDDRAVEMLYNMLVYNVVDTNPEKPNIKVSHVNKPLSDLDVDYINKKLELELFALGCKTVELIIGWKNAQYTSTISVPKFFGGRKNVVTTQSIDVFKWGVKVSW